MYVYVGDLNTAVTRLTDAHVAVVRQAEDMPWGERIATVADPEGNPVALCQAPSATAPSGPVTPKPA